MFNVTPVLPHNPLQTNPYIRHNFSTLCFCVKQYNFHLLIYSQPSVVRHFTNWWHLSHFPWTTAFTRTFATSILWCYNFNGMIKRYDISCATLYVLYFYISTSRSMCAQPIIIVIIIIIIIIVVVVVVVEVLLLTTKYNYRRYFLTGTTHHSTLGMFCVAADSAAITAIPFCCGSGSMGFNLKYCSQ